MAVEIRCASLQSHQAELIALFKRHLTSDSDERRFDWLYRQNPYGPARAWLASDCGNGTIVGAAAAFPRTFYFHGEKRSGWVLGDFCLAEEHRSMGPALQLQRACLQAMAPPYDFCYDFPSVPMMAIYKRLGIQQTGTLIRWAKPLRIEERLEPVVRSKTVARILGRVGGAMLAARGWKGRKDACKIELLQGPCGQEFTALDHLLGKQPGVRAERTAEHLNWRFLAHPSRAHEILAARRNTTLVGYVVLQSEPTNARIVDLVSVEEPAVIARLIGAAVNRMRGSGAKSVNLAAAEAHPWSAIFERAGFRRRESHPIVVVTGVGATIKETNFQTAWYLMEGERDS